MTQRRCVQPLRGKRFDTRLLKRATKRLCVALEKELDRAERATLVPEKVGILRKQASGRWAIFRPGHEPVEITSGELFRVEAHGELRVTRMEHLYGEGYYSIAGDGMRPANGTRE